MIDILKAYLLKPGTRQNHPKPEKTSRKKPKLAKATQKNCEMTQNDPQFQNWGNLGEFFASFCFSNFEPKCLIWAFWVKKY